jgi:hypothetical protein
VTEFAEVGAFYFSEGYVEKKAKEGHPKCCPLCKCPFVLELDPNVPEDKQRLVKGKKGGWACPNMLKAKHSCVVIICDACKMKLICNACKNEVKKKQSESGGNVRKTRSKN